MAQNDALFPLKILYESRITSAFLSKLSNKHACGRPGQRLAKALSQAGPGFIKIGQALSTREDLLGKEIAKDLSKLQDRIPAFSYEKAQQIIEEELGKTAKIANLSYLGIPR